MVAKVRHQLSLSQAGRDDTDVQACDGSGGRRHCVESSLEIVLPLPEVMDEAIKDRSRTGTPGPHHHVGFTLTDAVVFEALQSPWT